MLLKCNFLLSSYGVYLMIYGFIFVVIFFILYVSNSGSDSFSIAHNSIQPSIQKELKYSQPNSLSLFLSQCNFTEITRLIKSQSIILKCCSVELGLAISQKSADKTPLILHLQNEINQVFFRVSKDLETIVICFIIVACF